MHLLCRTIISIGKYFFKETNEILQSEQVAAIRSDMYDWITEESRVRCMCEIDHANGKLPRRFDTFVVAAIGIGAVVHDEKRARVETIRVQSLDNFLESLKAIQNGTN